MNFKYVINNQEVLTDRELTDSEIDEIASDIGGTPLADNQSEAETKRLASKKEIKTADTKPSMSSVVDAAMERQKQFETQFRQGAVENLPAIAGIGLPVVATALSGPLAPITAAGLGIMGSMAGETSRQQLQGEDFNISKVGQEGLLGAVGEGVSKALQVGVPAGIRAAKGLFGVGEEAPRAILPLAERQLAQQTAQNLGESIPASRVGGELTQLFEGVSRAGVGQGSFTAAEARLGSAFNKELTRIIDNVTSSPMSDVETGQALKTTLESAEKAVKDTVAPFYNTVIPTRGQNIPVDMTALSKEAKATLNKSLAMSQSGRTPLGLEAEDVGLLKQLSDVKANMSFAEAHELRSTLLAQGRKLESKYGPDNDFTRLVKGAIKTVNNQMDAAAESFDPELRSLYKETSKQYRDAMSTLFDKTVVQLLNKNPEKVGDALGASGNVTEAIKVRQALALASKNNVAGVKKLEENLLRGYLQQVTKGFDNNLSDFVALGDKLRDPKFKRTFNVMMQMNPDVRGNVEKLIRAARVAQDSSKPSMLGGGSVAAATTSAAVLPILAAGGGAAAAASTGMTALAALGLSQAVLARVLTSPLATNTLLAAERAYQSGNAAKAAQIIQQSQTIQRIIGQSLARTEPVAQGIAGVEQGE